MKLIQKLLLGVFLVSTLLLSLGAGSSIYALKSETIPSTGETVIVPENQIEQDLLTVCSAKAQKVGTLTGVFELYLSKSDPCVKYFTATEDADRAKTVMKYKITDTVTKAIVQTACGVLNANNSAMNGGVPQDELIVIKKACDNNGFTGFAEGSSSLNSGDSCGFGWDWFVCFFKSIGNSLAKSIVVILSAIVTLLATILSILVGWILQLLSFIANELLLINPASNQYIGVSRSVFGIFLNLVNLVIVFLFVKTGISFIFDDKKNPDISNFIITVATIAIGVQFSFALAAAVMALSYNIGYIFLQTVSPGSINPFTAFFDAINGAMDSNVQELVQRITSYFVQLVSGNAITTDITGSLLGAAAIQSSRLILFLVGLWIMWLFVVKFAIRAATMFFLLITAPIGFVFLIANDLDKDIKKFGDEWWKGLIANSLVYPIIVIALAIGARLVVQISALNTGNKITTTGFDLFDTGTYSIILAPMIQSILPGIVALGTLYLIYQWVEDNLKSSVGGIAQKIVQMAGKGANLATNAYRRAGISAAQTAGFMKGGGLKAIGSSLATPFAGIAPALKELVNSDPKQKLANATQAYRLAKVNARQAKQALYKNAVSQAVSWGQGYKDNFTTEGPNNILFRALPRRIEIDKNGNTRLVSNENAMNKQHAANVKVGLMDAAMNSSMGLRRMGYTAADIAVADDLLTSRAQKLGVKADNSLQGKGVADLEAMRSPVYDKVTGAFVGFRDKAMEEHRKAVQVNTIEAMNTALGIGKDNNYPDTDVMIDIIERDLLSDGIDGLGNKMRTANPVAVKYLRHMLLNGKDFAEDVRSHPVLSQLLTTTQGWETLQEQFRDKDFKQVIRGNLNVGTGWLPDSKVTNPIKATGKFKGEVRYIEGEVRKAAQSPEKLGGIGRNNVGTVSAIHSETEANGQSAKKAYDAALTGIATNSKDNFELLSEAQMASQFEVREKLKAGIDSADEIIKEEYEQIAFDASTDLENFFGGLASRGALVNNKTLAALEKLKRSGKAIREANGEFTQEAKKAILEPAGFVEKNGKWFYNKFEAALDRDGHTAQNLKGLDDILETTIKAQVAELALKASQGDVESAIKEFTDNNADLQSAWQQGLAHILYQENQVLSDQIKSGVLTPEVMERVRQTLANMKSGRITAIASSKGITDSTGASVTKNSFSISDASTSTTYTGKNMTDVVRVINAGKKEVEAVMEQQMTHLTNKNDGQMSLRVLNKRNAIRAAIRRNVADSDQESFNNLEAKDIVNRRKQSHETITRNTEQLTAIREVNQGTLEKELTDTVKEINSKL